MMLWFPRCRALAAAFPIISFGLGATLSTLVYRGVPVRALGMDWTRGISVLGVGRVFWVFAAVYSVMMVTGLLLLRKPGVAGGTAAASEGRMSYLGLVRDAFFLRSWFFMFLNISAGLCLIPLARQMMALPEVGYAEGTVTAVLALSGLMNGGGRLVFAWWSDRMAVRVNILLVILSISAGVVLASLVPVFIGLALLVVNACYGAGFSVIPAILADHYGMVNLSKIHGAVLSAWGVAGIAGNQSALFISDTLGLGYVGVMVFLVAVYLMNLWNAVSLRRIA